jgi:hypothetical protein
LFGTTSAVPRLDRHVPPRDLADDPRRLAEPHPVPHGDRPVHLEGEPSHHVRQEVLEREPEDGGDDRRGRNDPGHVDVPRRKQPEEPGEGREGDRDLPEDLRGPDPERGKGGAEGERREEVDEGDPLHEGAHESRGLGGARHPRRSEGSAGGVQGEGGDIENHEPENAPPLAPHGHEGDEREKDEGGEEPEFLGLEEVFCSESVHAGPADYDRCASR